MKSATSTIVSCHNEFATSISEVCQSLEKPLAAPSTSPAGVIGEPGTDRDDVLFDGRIITGENDPSAREMGRRIV